MPIRPENVARYSPDWAAITWWVKFVRAGSRCECTGFCGRPDDHLDAAGRCVNTHGAPAYGTGSRVVLTTAHLDHRPENSHPANLRALCQGCHLRYDRDHHAATRRATRTRTRSGER
jgi:hypothetical protein